MSRWGDETRRGTSDLDERAHNEKGTGEKPVPFEERVTRIELATSSLGS
jgi:hypothetical protein